MVVAALQKEFRYQQVQVILQLPLRPWQELQLCGLGVEVCVAPAQQVEHCCHDSHTTGVAGVAVHLPCCAAQTWLAGLPTKVLLR